MPGHFVFSDLRELFADEELVRAHVAHDDLEDKVELAAHVVALKHFGKRHDRFPEPLDRLILVEREVNEGQSRYLQAEPIRIEHWVVAERLGQTAAANMLGAELRFVEAPFFWSNHYDLSIHYVGRGAGWDRIEVDGGIEARDSTVRYFTGDRLIAAASLGRDLENLVLAQQLRAAPESV